MRNTLYVSPSPDGHVNLAVDEYFLDHVAPDELILYFYTNANAVIIGRGQNPWAECDFAAMERDRVQLVRRITGGGAVYHDAGNLNFSFIAGSARYDLTRQMNLILNALRSLGIPCEFSGRNDLLADGRKFSGNAFCTRGDARQHHGTLLVCADLSKLQNYLTVDPTKLKSKGVKSVRSRVCNLTEFREDLSCVQLLSALKRAFEAEYGVYTELMGVDEAAVEPYLVKQRSDEWRLGLSPRFDTEIRERFDWGGVQLLLTLRGGAVDEVQVYSDANDAELPAQIKACLSGVRYDPKEIASALKADGRRELCELAERIEAQG